MKYFVGIFYILHGIVHLLYMGHAIRYFELEKGFTWPENSKLLGSIFSLPANKLIANILCAIAALSFIVSGICVISNHSWYSMEILLAISVSTVLFIAFWDGSKRKLHTQGGIAILINILILFYTLMNT